MENTTIWKRTLACTGALLGISAAWVGIVCLGSLLIVGHALPEPASPAPAASPASPREPVPARPPTRDELPAKSRNG
jgi:hypothetical protein